MSAERGGGLNIFWSGTKPPRCCFPGIKIVLRRLPIWKGFVQRRAQFSKRFFGGGGGLLLPCSSQAGEGGIQHHHNIMEPSYGYAQ